MTIRNVKAPRKETAMFKPVPIGSGQQEMARKLSAKIGLVHGSLSSDILIGAVSYLLSTSERSAKSENPLKVKALFEAINKNKTLLNRVLGEVEEDYHAAPSALAPKK
jgi:hypothetical protein